MPKDNPSDRRRVGPWQIFVFVLLLVGVLVLLWKWKQDNENHEARKPDAEQSSPRSVHRLTPPTSPTNETEPVPATDTNMPAAEANTGKTEISGRVALNGKLPKPDERQRKVLAECSGEPYGARDYIVGQDGGLANVFVYVKAGLEGRTFTAPVSPIEITETNCHYEPYVFGARVGQSIVIQNSKHRHRMRLFFSNGKVFEWQRNSSGLMEPELEAIFDGPDVLSRFSCTVHPWNWGYVGVLSHPYFAVTDASGRYTLPKGIPDGTYTIAARHPIAGEVSRQVVTVTGGSYIVDFKLNAKPAPAIKEVPSGETEQSEVPITTDDRSRGPITVPPPSARDYIVSHVGGLPTADYRTAIIGRVTLKGSPPPERQLTEVKANADCGKLHTNVPTTRFYVISENGGLADTVVYLKQGLQQKFDPPKEPVLLDQEGCFYTPTVFALQTGQTLRVRNSDPFMHNVHVVPAAPGNKESNKAQMPKAADFNYTFDSPEQFLKFKCDVHPWMFAYAFVVDHPFIAVTDAKGNFAITNVPPGNYTVEAIHRKAGATKLGVVVRPGKTLVTDFVLEAK